LQYKFKRSIGSCTAEERTKKSIDSYGFRKQETMMSSSLNISVVLWIIAYKGFSNGLVDLCENAFSSQVVCIYENMFEMLVVVKNRAWGKLNNGYQIDFLVKNMIIEFDMIYYWFDTRFNNMPDQYRLT
jgi:hypothetical protein